MSDAVVHGSVWAEGLRIGRPHGVSEAFVAVLANGLEVRGVLFLDACVLEGRVLLRNARLGHLRARNARIESGHTEALDLGGAILQGGISLEGTSLEGALVFRAATLGGPATLSGCHVVAAVPEGAERGSPADSGRVAVDGDHARIGGWLRLSAGYATESDPATPSARNDRSVFEGRVTVRGAQVGGFVEARRGDFRNPGGTALDLSAATVRGGVHLGDAVITGHFRMVAASVGTALVWDTELRERARVILRGSRMTSLVWRRRAEEWPVGAQADLRGTTFAALGDEDGQAPLADGSEVTALRRLFATAPAFFPDTYRHLASVLRSSGRYGEARDVLIEMHQRRGKARSWPGRVIARASNLIVGHGYRPWRAAGWLGSATGVAVLLGWWADQRQWLAADASPPAQFNPLLYAADRLVPFLDLAQEDYYTPKPPSLAIAFAVLSIAAWALWTIAALTLTNAIRKDHIEGS